MAVAAKSSKYWPLVQYFGNYFVDLDEGDLIVFDPGDEATMYPAPSTSTNPTAPYTNGCYRVGIDIPAGRSARRRE